MFFLPNPVLQQGLPSMGENVPQGMRPRTSSATFFQASEQNHEGFLYKRGGLRKNWKLRWFVLSGEATKVSL